LYQIKARKQNINHNTKKLIILTTPYLNIKSSLIFVIKPVTHRNNNSKTINGWIPAPFNLITNKQKETVLIKIKKTNSNLYCNNLLQISLLILNNNKRRLKWVTIKRGLMSEPQTHFNYYMKNILYKRMLFSISTILETLKSIIIFLM